jgi:hypothetical protein
MKIILDRIGILNVIKGPKHHQVSPTKFNADVMEHVVTAPTEDQE